MLDIGWSELLVIAIVLIVVVGPKDLPPMLRAFGKMTSNLRKMAGDFRSQFDEALRESELDDVRRTISDAQRLNPTNALREAINPLRQMGQDIRNDLQRSTQVPSPPEVTKTDIEAQEAIEGAAALDAGPDMPEIFPTPAMTTASAAAAVPAVAMAAATTPAQSQPASISAPPAEKPSALRKNATRTKPEAGTLPAPMSETTAKPRRSAGPSRPAPAVQSGEEAAVTAPVRKRTPKKTETPKDNA